MSVVITGTSLGIGKSIAEKFLLEGYKVIGLDIKDSTIQNPQYTHIICDVRKELPEIDNVEIVITSVGVQLPDEETIDVNLKGTINVVEKYAFRKGIKSVVTIASTSGTNGAEFPQYSASKGGVIAYTKNVALRLAQYGATANSLSPGGVYTESNSPILNDPSLTKQVLNETLLQKWADPSEIADWAYFLAVTNKSMTGQDIIVDNGEIIKSNFIWPTK